MIDHRWHDQRERVLFKSPEPGDLEYDPAVAREILADAREAHRIENEERAFALATRRMRGRGRA
jgi:hypothetical protein